MQAVPDTMLFSALLHLMTLIRLAWLENKYQILHFLTTSENKKNNIQVGDLSCVYVCHLHGRPLTKPWSTSSLVDLVKPVEISTHSAKQGSQTLKKKKSGVKCRSVAAPTECLFCGRASGVILGRGRVSPQ